MKIEAIMLNEVKQVQNEPKFYKLTPSKGEVGRENTWKVFPSLENT
jgi:hypothetical protein